MFNTNRDIHETMHDPENHSKVYLAREGQEMPVNELGSKAVASMLLGSLDVVVDKVLRLEPLITALIGARERTLTSVIHQMELELCI